MSDYFSWYIILYRGITFVRTSLVAGDIVLLHIERSKCVFFIYMIDIPYLKELDDMRILTSGDCYVEYNEVTVKLWK